MYSDLGNEIKKVRCPDKYCSTKFTAGDFLPILLASIVVAYFSGTLLSAGGINIILTVLIETVFVVGMCFFTNILFKGVKKRLAETYISICENGICGIWAVNGYKNAEFKALYGEITKVTYRGDRVVITTNHGKIVLTLNDVTENVALICKKAGL